MTPLEASPDPLMEPLYKFSLGNFYIISVWTPLTLNPCGAQAGRIHGEPHGARRYPRSTPCPPGQRSPLVRVATVLPVAPVHNSVELTEVSEFCGLWHLISIYRVRPYQRHAKDGKPTSSSAAAPPSSSSSYRDGLAADGRGSNGGVASNHNTLTHSHMHLPRALLHWHLFQRPAGLTERQCHRLQICEALPNCQVDVLGPSRGVCYPMANITTREVDVAVVRPLRSACTLHS